MAIEGGLLDFLEPSMKPTDKFLVRKLKKLVTCPVCLSGQFAFWMYLWGAFVSSWFEYELFQHSYVTGASIVGASVLLSVIEYLNR